MLTPDHSLCKLILAHVPLYRRHDLHSLLLTSKSFHTAAEELVYHHIIFTDVRRIRLFVASLTNAPRLAGLVHTFGINLSELRMRAQIHRQEALNVQTVLRREFWEAVKTVLGAMTALENLVLVQIPGLRMNFTWMLSQDDEFPFALKEIKFNLAFDNHIARFLNAQGAKGRLHAVQLYNMAVPRISDALLSLDPTAANSVDGTEDGNGGGGIEDIRLPVVEVLDISLSITPHISASSLNPRLAHLQLYVDVHTTQVGVLVDALLHLLSASSSTSANARGVRKIRGLSLVEVPISLSTPLLAQLAQSDALSNLTSALHHLSHFHLPRPYPQIQSQSSRSRLPNSRSHSHPHSHTQNANQSPLDESPNISEKLDFLHTLTSFHSLHSLELSLSSWDFFDTSHTTIHNFGFHAPHPPPRTIHTSSIVQQAPGTVPSPTTQKVWLAELKMYCPSLRIVVFWLGKVRFRWIYHHAYYSGDSSEDGHHLNGGEAPEVLFNDMVPSWELQPEEDGVVQERTREGEGGGGGSGGGGSGAVKQRTGGASTIRMDCGPPKLQNAVVPGEWHYRMDANQWPGHSTLWSTC